jgi:hypothetical protein
MPAVTHTVPVHRVRTAAQPRENSRGSPWYAACCLSSVMERAFVLFPMVSAATGSLLDGLGGAVSSLLIPPGPLLVAGLFGTR